MKYFLTLTLFLTSLMASAQTQIPWFGQVHEVPARVDQVRFLIERSRCQVSYNGEIKPLAVYQTLGQADPWNTTRPVSSLDLSVFEGSRPHTITLKLIEWALPRSRRVVIKAQYDLPVDRLATAIGRDEFSRAKVSCL